jgi:transposase
MLRTRGGHLNPRELWIVHRRRPSSFTSASFGTLADKGYDSDAIRTKAKQRKARANIPPKANRKGTFAFSAWLYRQRNLVERFFNRIKHFRGIATRYDKHPANYLAAVKLVAARIWCQT